MVRKALWTLWATCVCTAVTPAAALAANDIVLYAADAVNLRGNWTRGYDSSAAGGQYLATPDRGWSSADSALAAPANTVDFTFAAPANTPYRVWFRLHAAGNSKYNDSLFAQFSDAVDANGAGIYRIGTTGALTLNLQICNGCALSGWGWVDGAYWLTQTSTVRFSTAGPHTLRLQTREDGVIVDQVVISPATYLSSAPGQPSNDATIVAKATGSTTPRSTPYTGTAAAVPGTIQAEDFDNGSEGAAYHDLTAANEGGAYRQTRVDIEPASEGGYDVGWIVPGEWLAYTVNVAAPGTYLLEARVASGGAGGTFHVEFGTTNVTGPLTIPPTGDWQAWKTISKQVTLVAGQQRMRLVFDAAAGSVGNVNWVRITNPAPAPVTGTAAALPGTVRVESFDNGGEGVAYHDTSAGNEGGQARQTDVDIEVSSTGGYDIGWTTDGEWVRYSVNVAAAGDYLLRLQVASPYDTGRVHAAFGAVATPALAVPNTGDWQAWTTISQLVTLAAGPQSLAIVVDKGGFNFGNITVTAPPATPTTPAPNPNPPSPNPPNPNPPNPNPPPTPPTGGQTTTVNAGGDLQAALNSALPGDTILLQAGATFVGNFVLPVKNGSTPIIIRSAAPDASLPAAGVRMTPAYASQLPKLQSPTSLPALTTAPGAHHYTLMFLELKANVQGLGDILTLGDGDRFTQNTLASVPHDLIVDRVYVHGDPVFGQKRGIGLNSASTVIVNSYIAEIKADGQDSQAIGGWNGPGPYTIANNYLEAAGENLLIGGADPGIPNLVPSDITIKQNYFTKQLAWRTQPQWNVKNLLELKNAQRVVIDGNVLEYSWEAAQSGYAVMLTPRNQDGTAPWSIVQNVRFTNNIVRHAASGIAILGTDDEKTSQMTNDIVVRNNLFEDISSKYGGAGRFLFINGGANIAIDHNTVMQDGWTAVYADVHPVSGFVLTNNIIPDYQWAIMGGNTGPGNNTIATYFPNGQFFDGVFIGSSASSYPAGNYYPATMSAVGFMDVANGNYRLSAASIYRNAASDGKNVGCDVDAINLAAGTKY